jgi:hypothetical protein
VSGTLLALKLCFTTNRRKNLKKNQEQRRLGQIVIASRGRRGQLTPITDHNVLIGRVAELSAQARQQPMPMRQKESDAERDNDDERANDAGSDGAGALLAAVRLVGLGQDGGGGGGGEDEGA